MRTVVSEPLNIKAHWDGRISEQLAPIDVYVVLVEWIDLQGRSQIATSDVTLVR